MLSADGRYAIVFNGEIYNFPEIKQRLQRMGLEFRTTSDTEVILQAWIAWGSDCLHEFNGMWAFLLWDLMLNEGFLCRDRFGVKPLYYCCEPDQLTVCSEIDAIGRFNGIRSAENFRYLSAIIGGDPRPFSTSETHIEGVRSLPAGHLARIGPDTQLDVSRWYQLMRRPVPENFADQVVAFRELFTDACRVRLRSDVPIATCLSGGIDSGSIVSTLQLIEKQGGSTGTFSHRSFTAAFPGTPLDETRLTDVLARCNRVHLDEHRVQCPSLAMLETALRLCDGPMPTMAFFPIWKLYRHIRESGITVTLDGQGSDEMLGGYFIGPEALISGWQSRNPWRMQDLWSTYQALHADGLRWMATAKGAVKRYAMSEIDQTIKKPLKTLAALMGLYSPRPNRMPLPVSRPDSVDANDPDQGDWLAHKLWDQFFCCPLPFYLHQYDRCSMASGVECRMPFMDYRLVEFVYSLPLSSRIGGGYTKRILRNAMRGLVPDEILDNRLKMGFNAPFKEWISEGLRDWVMDISGSQTFLTSPLFDGPRLRSGLELRSGSDALEMDERTLWPALHWAWWKDQGDETSREGLR